MDDRAYPTRPFLAASAAVIRDGRVLIVRRGGTFGRGIYTLPGGVVEAGETLTDAVIREVQEETGVAIEPVALAGYREMIMRDDDGKTVAAFRDRVLRRALDRRRTGAGHDRNRRGRVAAAGGTRRPEDHRGAAGDHRRRHGQALTLFPAEEDRGNTRAAALPLPQAGRISAAP